MREEAGLKFSASWRLAEDTNGTTMIRSIPLEKEFDDCLGAVKINSARGPELVADGEIVF